MTPEQRLLQFETRRHFFSRCGVGVGKIALASMLGGRMMSAATTKAVNPNAPKPPHFPPKVKNVIYLFMAGGPSQLELFDYKPALQQLHNQPIPDSFIAGKRFAFMSSFTREKPKCLGTRRKFTRHGQHGTYVSDCFPHIASIA